MSVSKNNLYNVSEPYINTHLYLNLCMKTAHSMLNTVHDALLRFRTNPITLIHAHRN